MGIFFSAIAAAFFGIADYAGGSASRRIPVVAVICFSHTIGFCLVLLSALLWRAPFGLESVSFGALAGVLGGSGVWLFYRALSRGPMATVTPIAAVLSATVPVLWSMILGESLRLAAWAGVTLAIVAVAMVSVSKSQDRVSVAWVTMGDSIGAGLLFGTVFVTFDHISAEGALWPIVGARFMTGVVLLVVLLVVGLVREPLTTLRQQRPLLGLVGTAGLLDTSANVSFLVASDLGNLAVVSVVAGMYPVATVGLARVVDGERLRRIQSFGVVLLLVATGLLLAGG